MDKVFVLWHSHVVEAYAMENKKVIGTYWTEEDAKAAITRLSSKPGFRETPEGFTIVPYVLNEDHFAEGFTGSEGAMRT